NEGAFHEAVTNRILDDLVAALTPRRMTVEGDFFVRGGIHTTVVAEHAARGGSRARGARASGDLRAGTTRRRRSARRWATRGRRWGRSSPPPSGGAAPADAPAPAPAPVPHPASNRTAGRRAGSRAVPGACREAGPPRCAGTVSLTVPNTRTDGVARAACPPPRGPP